MEQSKRRVLLYGNSLILEGVRASLATCSNLEIIWLDSSVVDLFESIRALCPAVFIFDLGAVRPDFQLSLLQQPGLLLIGMDPATQQAVVWSGRQAAAAVASDLIKMLASKGSHSEK